MVYEDKYVQDWKESSEVYSADCSISGSQQPTTLAPEDPTPSSVFHRNLHSYAQTLHT